jgi:hypothetical protein
MNKIQNSETFYKKENNKSKIKKERKKEKDRNEKRRLNGLAQWCARCAA